MCITQYMCATATDEITGWTSGVFLVNMKVKCTSSILSCCTNVDKILLLKLFQPKQKVLFHFLDFRTVCNDFSLFFSYLL